MTVLTNVVKGTGRGRAYLAGTKDQGQAYVGCQTESLSRVRVHQDEGLGERARLSKDIGGGEPGVLGGNRDSKGGSHDT